MDEKVYPPSEEIAEDQPRKEDLDQCSLLYQSEEVVDKGRGGDEEGVEEVDGPIETFEIDQVSNKDEEDDDCQ